MSTEPVSVEQPITEAAHSGDHAEHHGPTPALYVKVAILLAVMTAVEVALFYLERDVEAFTESMAVPLLLILAALKFVTVIAYYMHLRYEKPMLSRLFATGFVLAMILYGVVLATFGVIALRG